MVFEMVGRYVSEHGLCGSRRDGEDVGGGDGEVEQEAGSEGEMRMESVKFCERFEPKVIYLRNNESGYCCYIPDCCGKTARSWVSGKWKAELHQFREYTEISEHDYNEWAWALQHRYRIGQLVACSKDPAVVRAVAKLVGFVEVTS